MRIDSSLVRSNETNKVTNEPDVVFVINTRRTRSIIHELINDVTSADDATTNVQSVHVVVWLSLIGLKFSIQTHHVVDFVTLICFIP